MELKETAGIPVWMQNKNEYSPKSDRESFISKSILKFINLFRLFHITKNENISRLRAGNRTILVLGLIILSSISRNLFFNEMIAAGFLLYISFVKTAVLKRVLCTSFIAAIFTALIMLPSYFMYKSNAFITLSLKVFLSTGMLSLYAFITPWNKITSALSFIKIPGFIIYILNITIQYILILGNIAFEMLTALKLRSVGKNKTKEKSFSGILGTLFLKSVAYSQETQQAMECRLFDGSYFSPKSKVHLIDFVSIIVLIFYIILFFFIA